ncbi:MAG: hypothetical protein LBR26_05380 [Prevotella sp.]|nr:hypothetical protein [Prevotella sp.]
MKRSGIYGNVITSRRQVPMGRRFTKLVDRTMHGKIPALSFAYYQDL